MNTYIFSKDNVSSVIAHISSYQLTVQSLTPDADSYVMVVDGALPEGEYEHLNQEYGLVEVVQ